MRVHAISLNKSTINSNELIAINVFIQSKLYSSSVFLFIGGGGGFFMLCEYFDLVPAQLLRSFLFSFGLDGSLF